MSDDGELAGPLSISQEWPIAESLGFQTYQTTSFNADTTTRRTSSANASTRNAKRLRDGSHLATAADTMSPVTPDARACDLADKAARTMATTGERSKRIMAPIAARDPPEWRQTPSEQTALLAPKQPARPPSPRLRPPPPPLPVFTVNETHPEIVKLQKLKQLTAKQAAKCRSLKLMPERRHDVTNRSGVNERCAA